MESLAKAGRRIFLWIQRNIYIAALCFFLVTGAGTFAIHKAFACASCPCVIANHIITRAIVLAEHGEGLMISDPEVLAYTPVSFCDPGFGTRGWIGFEFCRHREEFMVFYWFKEHVLAAMMMMTEQLVSNAMNQMFIIGTFFDAQQQIDTERVFQELSAQAHKDYHPSFGMCEIGTMSRSLAASQRQGEFNAYALSQQLEHRQMRNLNMASASGKGTEIIHRWEQFKTTFCNPDDNDRQLRLPDPICAGLALARVDAPRNWDIDYTHMVNYPNTISVDYTDANNTLKEQSIFALAANLYGNDVFEYWPKAYFQNENNQDDYMYLREIVAKRSVAQNSFNAIVGMKSEGKAESEETVMPYMRKVMEQLGIENVDEQQQIVAGTLDNDFDPNTRPSYYAQMEILSKKLYQRPEFYTDLYDKPANIERKKAAMKAIDLIQTMDLFKSKLRMEAALSVLTSMEIDKQQEVVQDRMNEARETGIQR